MGAIGQNRPKKWFDKYLPFIARPPQMQVAWLVQACAEKKLSQEELTPYLRLLLSKENVENDEQLREVLAGIDRDTSVCLFEIVEIFDLPRLILTFPAMDSNFARLALQKEIPPYEKNIRQIVDNVFAAINDRSPQIFQEIVTGSDEFAIADHFRNNLQRFQKILDDQEFLRSLYPNAN